MSEEKQKIKIPEGFDEMSKHPIYKPVSEYLKSAEIFEQEDERESDELKKALTKLNSSIDEDIISESVIAQLYERIGGVYERLLWIYSKNVSLANSKIKDMLDVIGKYYVTRKDYDERLAELEKEYEERLTKVIKPVVKEEPPKKIPVKIKEEIKEINNVEVEEPTEKDSPADDFLE